MLRRKLLKEQSDPEKQFILIADLNPKTCHFRDVKTLLLIKKARPSDRLAHLAMEADWWLKNHFKILKKRFCEGEGNNE